MLVHFISNNKDTRPNQFFRQTIADVIKKTSSTLTENIIIDSPEDRIDWDTDSLAVKQSDVVIIEATSFDFRQGYTISMALQNKKPTLLLFRKGKNVNVSNINLTDRLVAIKQYDTEEQLTLIVERFLKDNSVSTKDLRFNFFIDRHIYSFLREVSYETGRNKSEIIRDLIEAEISKRRK